MPFFLRRFNRDTEKAIRVWKLNQLKTELPSMDGMDKSIDRAMQTYDEMMDAFGSLEQNGISMHNGTIAEYKSKLNAKTVATFDNLLKLGYKCNTIGGILVDIWTLEEKIRQEAIPLNEVDEKLREIEDRIKKFHRHLNPNWEPSIKLYRTKAVERFWTPYWECKIIKDKKSEVYNDGFCATLDSNSQIKSQPYL